MSMHHSEETHKQLLARVPQATGRDLPEWFKAIEQGPSLMRFEERVNWLQDEHGIPHSHARAIVHEYDRQRASRKIS
jgi:hypothetical protein